MLLMVVGMCDGTTATAIVVVWLWLWLLSVIVIVMIAIVLDRCAECVLEDLGQDIFHMYWDITKCGGFFFLSLESGNDDGEFGDEMDGNGETHAKVASVAPSIMMGGAAPSDASQSSLTNELHIRIISTGDRAVSTMPTLAFACSGFCSA